MKIVLLTPLFPPKWLGGTEIATYNIAKHLAKNNHEVHIITTYDQGMLQKEKKDGFYIHRVKRIDLPLCKTLGYSYVSYRKIKEISPDMIHAQFIFTGLVGYISKLFLKLPYVVYARGSDVYLNWPFKNFLTKKIINNANAVICLTQDMKKELLKVFDREFFVIPNGFDQNILPQRTKGDLRKELGIKVDENIILFVGSLRRVKGVKYLIKAMAIITQQRKNVRLFLVGDGGERANLIRLVKDLKMEKYIYFIGKVPNVEVQKYMKASDIFVLPSVSESFGIVNLEAMAAGLPIVATDVCGVSEIVENEKNGFLIEPKNVNQISEKVSILLDNNALSEKISQKNRENVRKYEWETIVDNIINIYQRSIQT